MSRPLRYRQEGIGQWKPRERITGDDVIGAVCLVLFVVWLLTWGG